MWLALSFMHKNFSGVRTHAWILLTLTELLLGAMSCHPGLNCVSITDMDVMSVFHTDYGCCHITLLLKSIYVFLYMFISVALEEYFFILTSRQSLNLSYDDLRVF